MIIIHQMNNSTNLLPRALAPSIRAAMRTMPVVVVTGARQTGKSTLVHRLLPGTRLRYLTLDDYETLDRIRREPAALLQGRGPVVIDEVQRAPGVLVAVKREVDRSRRPGRFLLTGSANLALLKSVSESLAGRAAYFDLHPLTTSELAGRGGTGPWDRLLTDPGRLKPPGRALDDLPGRLFRGGFPGAALVGGDAHRRLWLDGYVRTYLERDLRDVSSVADLADFRRLMRMAALRTGAMVNQTELSRDAGLHQPTVHRYLNLLEATCLIHRVPGYAVNRTKRLIRTPRLFWCDTGLAAHLAGIESAPELRAGRMDGFLLENLVLLDLLAWSETRTPRPAICYWRTSTGEEVDFVVEVAGSVIPIEIKSAKKASLGDARHLQTFLAEYGASAPFGLLLHNGTELERIAERVWAVPLGTALGL